MVTKNDRAWERLFASYDVIATVESAGFYRITAAVINQEREARLMTKFDQEVNLPQIFKDNQLAILPDSRGSYLIGRFQTYQAMEDDETIEVTDMSLPADIESIDPTNLYSEASALLCAYNSQIIDDLIGEEMRFTVGGRMSTGRFEYDVKLGGEDGSQRITVNNAQAEIDGGFESASSLVLVEAKNYSAPDFLIRQLYYPYRLWRSRTRKHVIPVFMSFSNDVFSFYIYRFADEAVYNSIELLTQKKYRIAPINIQLADILVLLSEVERQPALPEPATVPFPQADSFVRVLDLLGLLYANEILSKEQITTNYAFDARQTDYYTNAGIYLGLVQKRRDLEAGAQYLLTDEGKHIYSMSAMARRLALARSILRHSVFSRAFRLYLDNSERPSGSSVVEIMRDERIQISSTTMPRRAQTVLSWIDWILKLAQPD